MVALEKRLRLTPQHLALVHSFIQNKSSCIAACALEGYGFAFIGKLSMIAYNLRKDPEQNVVIVPESSDLCLFCEKEVRCGGKCMNSSYAGKMDVRAGESYTAADLLGRIRGAR